MPDEAAPSPPPNELRADRSKRRRWLFRSLALLMGGTLVALAEVVLRLCGVGTAYSLVTPVTPPPATLAYQLNPAIDRVYFGNRDLAGPEPRRFDLPKPRQTCRLLFLGASSVQGFPYASEISFPRQVEILLEAQQPEVDFEVLNAGTTAINSFQLVDLARQAADCQPDLVLLYAGHNEFYGPGGPASNALALPDSLIDAVVATRRMRLAQLVGRIVPNRPPSEAHPLAELPRLTNIAWGDPLVARAESSYRTNLRRILSSFDEAGIPVVMATPACNLRDQGPIRTVWPTRLTPSQRTTCEQSLDRVDDLISRGEWQAALVELEKAEADFGEIARLQFRKGQVLEALEQWEQSRHAYSLARDYDGCRFRAPGTFSRIVRDIAAEFSGQVVLLDLERKIADASAPHAPGEELFLEHVHFTLRGHRLVAREFARAVLQDVLNSSWDPSRDLDDVELDRQLGLLPEDQIVGDSFALEVTQTSPMAEALDAEVARERLRKRIEAEYKRLDPLRAETFADLSLQEMQTQLAAALSKGHARRGHGQLAIEYAKAETRRRPWSAQAWRLLEATAALADDQATARHAENRRRNLGAN